MKISVGFIENLYMIIAASLISHHFHSTSIGLAIFLFGIVLRPRD